MGIYCSFIILSIATRELTFLEYCIFLTSINLTFLLINKTYIFLIKNVIFIEKQHFLTLNISLRTYIINLTVSLLKYNSLTLWEIYKTSSV